MNPRIIVRATVVALGATIVAGSAFAAQASEISSESRKVSLTAEVGIADDATLAAKGLTVTGSATAVKAVHFNALEARSKIASKMRGSAASAYTGKFFTRKAEAFRKCVTERESENIYAVVGGGDLDGDGSGDYLGAYQLSPKLARGATWMMAKESKKAGDGLLGEIRELRKTPANEWSRYWQDRAFYTILNWDGHYSGAKHWAGGRWNCRPGM